ncbi:MAG: rhomboid family intramembrane serine protease [Methylacidiphilales bacterium]|nr:rhomboid family intramembrane serine protease [Candidatus Methylacidiphilales bacterium]
MLYHEQSEDFRPLFWMQGRPIYANTLLVIFHIAAFVIAALFISYFGLGAVFDALALNTPLVWHGEVWRLFSYVAFDPAFFIQRSLWFLINIALFWFFGREVEQFVGRKSYLKLYAGLVFIPAILLSLLGLFISLNPFLNCCEVFFGMFIAFATIYPGALPSLWFPITAATLAWILLGISTVLDIAFHDFDSFFMLWTSSTVAYVGMRLVGAGRGMTWFTDWLEEKRAQRLARERNFKVLRDQQSNESIDAILDKISKNGVGSLNASERAALERARTKLIQRDQR